MPKRKEPQQDKDQQKFKEHGKRYPRKPKDPKVPAKLAMNDPSWYVLHPELLRDVASLPFSHWLGKGFPIDKGYNTKESVMLILPFYFVFGYSTNADSPVNLAIRNLYTYVRHQNSGHTNYESADLGLYLLETGAIVACLAHIERIIGLAKSYQRRNAILPRELLKALGVVNVDNFVANLANWTTRINVAWQRVSSLCIPRDFKFIQRWIWMNSQVFKDHESDKAALIAFRPVSVPQFLANVTGTGGCIQQANESTVYSEITDFMDDIELAITRVMTDEDMNIMSGDILKAYGRENCMEFGMTPLDYVVKPVYVEEMLPQVQHAMTLNSLIADSGNGPTPGKLVTSIPRSVGEALNDQTLGIYVEAAKNDTFTIYQANGELVCAPANVSGNGSPTTVASTGELFWSMVKGRPTSRLLNSYKESPEPADVMIASRLMYVQDRLEAIGTGYGIVSCGTEIIKEFELYVAWNNPNATVVIKDSLVDFPYTTTQSGAARIYEDCVDLEQIDWHPFIYALDERVLSAAGIKTICGDIDNFTIITNDTIKNLNLNAVLAELSVTKYNLIND